MNEKILFRFADNCDTLEIIEEAASICIQVMPDFVRMSKTEIRQLISALRAYVGDDVSGEGFFVKKNQGIEIGRGYRATSITADGQYVCLVPLPESERQRA